MAVAMLPETHVSEADKDMRYATAFSPPDSLTDTDKKIATSTLDLFMLTFNCAKNLTNVAAFASHLYGALSQNTTAGLPDLVAL